MDFLQLFTLLLQPIKRKITILLASNQHKVENFQCLFEKVWLSILINNGRK